MVVLAAVVYWVVLSSLAPRSMLVMQIVVLAAAFSAPFLARYSEAARLLFSALALTDLAVVNALALSNAYRDVAASTNPRLSDRILLTWLADALALACGGKLLRGSAWPEWLLPLKGLHARRGLSAVTIGTLLITGVIGLGITTTTDGPFFLICCAALLCYLQPLWDVLARGWLPPS